MSSAGRVAQSASRNSSSIFPRVRLERAIGSERGIPAPSRGRTWTAGAARRAYARSALRERAGRAFSSSGCREPRTRVVRLRASLAFWAIATSLEGPLSGGTLASVPDPEQTLNQTVLVCSGHLLRPCMKLNDAREGEVVNVRQRPTAFSFFPTYQGATREGLHSTVFATEPWNLIRRQLEQIAAQDTRRQALAFLAQSRDFYSSAQHADVNAAKPLLLYYSFLNLAKCLVVSRNGTALGSVHHGLTERLPTTAGAMHGNVSIDITRSPGTSAFVMLASALGAGLPQPVAPATHVQIRSQDFLAQILIGHRVFCQSESILERFVSLHSIDYVQDATTREAWLRVRAFADDFTRLGYPLTSLSKSLDGSSSWRNVNCDIKIDNRRIIEAETTTTTTFNQRPSQALESLSIAARSRLWRSVTAYPPYRKYYIYKPTTSQVLVNQLLAIYLATFYFGSITRYKPEQFEDILRSQIGPFVLEFFSNQPSQFLYLMASEFMGQEVARAAIT